MAQEPAVTATTQAQSEVTAGVKVEATEEAKGGAVKAEGEVKTEDNATPAAVYKTEGEKPEASEGVAEVKKEEKEEELSEEEKVGMSHRND